MSFSGDVEPNISEVRHNGVNLCPGPSLVSNKYLLISHHQIFISVAIANVRASKSFPGKYGKKFIIDGHISDSWTKFYVSASARYPWVELEFSNTEMIARIEIVNRYDCCGENLKDVVIRAGMNPLPHTVGSGWLTINGKVGSFKGPSTSKKTENIGFGKPV